MWMTQQQCLDQLSVYDDTHELKRVLDEIAERSEADDAYFLREIGVNLIGMHALMRSMAGRIQQGASNGALPTSGAAHVNSVVSASLPVLSTSPERRDLLDLPSVLNRIGVGRTYWYAALKTGDVPKGVRIGRRRFWPASEIDAWIKTL